MSAATFQKYKMKLSLVGHQETPREPVKTRSGRYTGIKLQRCIVHTTPDNENPLHCQMTQLIEIGYPKSG